MDTNPDPAVARLDAQHGNEYGNDISDRVANMVVHAGDTIKPHWDEHGHLIEYRLYDQGGVHYATFHGTAFPNDAIAITAIAYHPHVGDRRKLLPVRPQPQPHPLTQPNPTAPVIDFYPGATGDNSITVTQPPRTLLGDPNVTTYGASPLVTIAHEHDHPHYGDGDTHAFAYWHRHPHEHTGVGTIWLAEHGREAHDHPHPDDDEPDRRPAG